MTNDTMDTLDKQKYTPGEMYMILAVLYFSPPNWKYFISLKFNKVRSNTEYVLRKTQMSHVIMSHFTPGFIETHTIKQY